MTICRRLPPQAAEKVIQEAQQPQGSSRFERVRLADTAEDSAKSGREDEEIIEYYEYAASKGDTRAQLAMGHLSYWGARGLAQNFEVALTWFHRAAEGGDSHAMSMLGHMYANGLAAKQDNETALHWFDKAHALGFAGAGNGLGYMHMHGMGVAQDFAKALEFFVAASEKGNAEAHFNLGAMYIDGIGVDQDNSKALQHFAVAAGEGHTMALYNLAVMHHNGLGTARSCDLAVQYLKNVVERGKVAFLALHSRCIELKCRLALSHDLRVPVDAGSWISVLQNASKSFDDEDYETALRMYTLAAEQGVEMAQSNAAWILDNGYGVGGSLVKNNAERYRLALHYFTLSAQQSNAASLLKLADYSYYGLGTDVDYEGSAAYYMQASEMRSPQAYFNLGFMHQFGLGLPQDFHLAKRFYDMTLQASDSAAAQAPVFLAVGALSVSIWWAGAKKSLPTSVVEAVESFVEMLGIGQPPQKANLVDSGSDATEPNQGGISRDSAGGSVGAGDADSAGELWRTWSQFVADTVGVWEQYTEKIRLALDPTTLKATFGFGNGSGSTALAGADSDTILIAVLAVMLAMVWVRRRRAIAMAAGVQ
eukprot:SAG31_NODE_4295_length_3374_cov_2.224733_3_plen_593_part_00